MERQSHGFEYERSVIDRFQLTKYDDYTSKFDAFSPEHNLEVSIKCIKQGGGISFGDIFRCSEIKEDFLLIIGFWKGTKSNIVEEYVLRMKANEWSKNFSGFELNQFKTLMDSVTNAHNDDVKWKSGCKELKKKWNERSPWLQPFFKRDHKAQKRIQCGLGYKIFIREIVNGKGSQAVA